MATNLTEHSYYISKQDRNQKYKHSSLVVWFTGLSGSGKSTIANLLEKKLFNNGVKTYSLDGDNIRTGLNRGLTFSIEDRKENNRRVAEISKLFLDAGIVTITAFISPLKADREEAKGIIEKENFVEIFVSTPLSVCEERDVKGLYRKARAGEIQNFTGISSPYEPPTDPMIEINTEQETPQESVERIFEILIKRIKLQ